MRRVFVHFLEEIEDTKMTFRNHLTFMIEKEIMKMKKKTEIQPKLITQQRKK